MSFNLFVLVLFAAVLHACWNACVKHSGEREIILMGVSVVSALACAVLLPFVGVPDQASWLYIFLSIIIHTAYFLCLIQAYTYGDLSHVYPLARGSAPLLILVGAALFAHERPNTQELIAVVLVSIGIISLSFEAGVPWRTKDKRPLFYALLTGLCIASYTVIDGIGVRLSGNVFAYVAWLFFLHTWFFSGYVLIKRKAMIWPYIKLNWLICLGGGIASLLAYGIVIYALNQGLMASVSALRETSVVFATLIGIFVLKEKHANIRIAAGCIVALGLVVINL